MATTTGSPSPKVRRFDLGYQQWVRDIQLGVENLYLHGLRSLLTMLGMIFGVAAVVAMLSIGAGARQKVMALIEQMGVRTNTHATVIVVYRTTVTILWRAGPANPEVMIGQ